MIDDGLDANMIAPKKQIYSKPNMLGGSRGKYFAFTDYIRFCLAEVPKPSSNSFKFDTNFEAQLQSNLEKERRRRKTITEGEARVEEDI